MNELDVLHAYENIAHITEQMLAAARAGDWDRLAELEQGCSVQVGMLQQNETPLILAPASRQRKVDLIKKILADDRAIRNLTQPWMEQLSRLINSTGTERKLNQAYGVSHAS